MTYQGETAELGTNLGLEWETFKLKKLTEELDHRVNPYFRNSRTDSGAYRQTDKPEQVPSGKGTLRSTESSSIVYVGEFKSGYRHGFGSAKIFGTVDRSTVYIGDYNGFWAFNHRHGFGELKYPNGGSFLGQWSFDRRGGLGVETDIGGGKYVGVWNDDQRHGTGLFTWPDESAEWRDYEAGRVVRFTPAKAGVKFAAEEKLKQLETKCQFEQKAAAVEDTGSASVPLGCETPPAPSASLNLASKRAIKELQEGKLATFEKQLQQACSNNKIKLEIDFNSFTSSPAASVAVWTLLVYNFGLVINPIIATFEALAQSDPAFYKEVFEETPKIVIVNQPKLHELVVKKAGGAFEIAGSFELGEPARILPAVLTKKITSL